MSQSKLIENHLTDGFSITPIQALNLYGCLRLSARILELRKKGMPIIDIGRKNYSEYFLDNQSKKD